MHFELNIVSGKKTGPFLSLIALFFGFTSLAQSKTISAPFKNNSSSASPTSSSIHFVAGSDHDLFGTRFRFKENVGQYGDTVIGYGSMGKIIYGYDKLSMPVLFTEKGLVYLQRKIKEPTHSEKKQ